VDVCDTFHDPWSAAVFRTERVPNSSPLCDGPWTIVTVDGDGKASDGSPSHGHGEAGAERVRTGLWFVHGYNHETHETYLNSSHTTKAGALATAADLAAGTGYERED
jgi:hypothetical protein